MNIAIYSRDVKEVHRALFLSLIDFLKIYEIPFTIFSEVAEKLTEYKFEQIYEDRSSLILQKPDLLICMGGDGTMLDTVILTKDTDIPVLGVNLGRLGFLANTNKEELFQTITHFVNGKYEIEERMLLEVNSNIPIFINENIALNDLTFLRANSSSMIEVKVYANGEFLNNYFADGLIIATSTGSTGYSLSCGGPILHPKSHNFVITPIAPHNLNIRPIVMPDDVILSFEIKGRTPEFLCTLDSRLAYITSNHLISVKKAKNTFKILNVKDNSFLEALKYKLHWGNQNIF
jgi:NAD+ kinase